MGSRADKTHCKRALRARWPGSADHWLPERGRCDVRAVCGRNVSAVSLDTTVSLSWIDANLPVGMPIQGNLDPVYLLTGRDAMDAAVDRIMGACANRPHIFNLGHGVDKQTSPDTVSRLLITFGTKAA